MVPYKYFTSISQNICVRESQSMYLCIDKYADSK